eukprot:1195856-Prorocentrum_minimum.AAC.3
MQTTAVVHDMTSRTPKKFKTRRGFPISKIHYYYGLLPVQNEANCFQNWALFSNKQKVKEPLSARKENSVGILGSRIVRETSVVLTLSPGFLAATRSYYLCYPYYSTACEIDPAP